MRDALQIFVETDDLPLPAPASPSLDLQSLAQRYRSGEISPAQMVDDLLRRMADAPDRSIWIHRLTPRELFSQAKAVEHRRANGERLPLYGLPFAVKDIFDVAGHPTTAGCPAFSYVAKTTSPVVSRLMDAGAILVGKTNLDQFSTGLAGDRTPYGIPGNLFDENYIAGGSSSGSALAVAAGLVSFALGSDTAGSGRVPAACNNIVGLKPTPGLLSTAGMVPACHSLDCVAVFALTVADAWKVFDVARHGGQPERLRPRPAGSRFLFAVPREAQLEFFGDSDQQGAFAEAIESMQALGGTPVEIDFEPFFEVAALLYDGPWLAERLAPLQSFLESHQADVVPVTRTVLAGGSRYSAVDYFNAASRLAALRVTCSDIFQQAEILAVPTFPTLPTLAAAADDSPGWGRRLGYYTNFVNLLGLSALALPAGFTPAGLPHGVTLIGRAESERELCELGAAWQRARNLPLGATGSRLPPEQRSLEPTETSSDLAPAPCPEGYVRVAVAGAHLDGQPLHGDLRRWGARYVRTCRTAPRYRFLALMHLAPPRPGLLRDETRAGAVEVEIYDMPFAGFGRLVASVLPPLAIGTVELADGEAVKGFLCESFASAVARDITDFGGWRAFREQSAVQKPGP
jgi:allophanate hydrolase